MADRRDAEPSAASLSEVRATLLRVADRLSSLEETPSPNSTRKVQQNTNPSPAACLSASVAAEQRRLFSHGNNAKRARSSGSSLPKSKRNATCTLKFVCLAAKADRPPMSVKERTALANAGLGDASITFGFNKSSVYNGIIQRFPQLSEVGGFDLLLFQRGNGEGAGFHRILPPHTPQRLKELCGQAKIFIRPLQKDIELDDKGGEDKEDVDSDVPMINCFTCGAAIIMTDMQEHQETHQQGETKQPEDDFEFSADNDSNWEPPPMLQPSQSQKQQQDEAHTGTSTSLHESPISTLDNQTDEDDLDSLVSMFPDKDRNHLRRVLNNNLSLQDAIDELLCSTQHSVPSLLESETACKSVKSLPAALKALGKKIVGDKVKVKVDQEDILSDALVIYKSSSFDPTCPLMIQYRMQPAIDTGGVLREFYTDVFREFVVKPGMRLFEGPPERLQFCYNHQALTCGLPKMLGTMIAHSLCQDGPGFPYLSPCNYYYIATGNTEHAVAYATIADVFDTEVREFVEQVSTAKKEDLGAINNHPNFLTIASECGLSCLVTEENQLLVTQAIIGHHAVVRRVAMMDQFCCGLNTLGVLQEIRKLPSEFQKLFVPSLALKTPSYLRGLLKLPVDGNEKCKKVVDKLLRFVDESSENGITEFLKFTTGGSTPPPTDIFQIVVEVSSEASAIFASTCLRKLVLPESLAEEDDNEFRLCLNSVMDGKGNAFSAP